MCVQHLGIAFECTWWKLCCLFI